MKVTCPWCRTETEWEGNPWRPFCSERCRLLDLGAWASGQYAIPGPPVEEEQTAEASTEPEHPARGEQTEALPSDGGRRPPRGRRHPRQEPGGGEPEVGP